MHRDNVLNVLQQTEEKRRRFLEAWKHGVEYLGPKFFGPGSPETARITGTKADTGPRQWAFSLGSRSWIGIRGGHQSGACPCHDSGIMPP